MPETVCAGTKQVGSGDHPGHTARSIDNHLLFDLLSLDLMFLAFRYQPGFGPLLVAYTAANIASALPLTPGGLGVIEVTLVAITVGFGAPRNTAVLAVLAYRVINYWLPLPVGAAAYLRIRVGATGRHGPRVAPK